MNDICCRVQLESGRLFVSSVHIFIATGGRLTEHGQNSPVYVGSVMCIAILLVVCAMDVKTTA